MRTPCPFLHAASPNNNYYYGVFCGSGLGGPAKAEFGEKVGELPSRHNRRRRRRSLFANVLPTTRRSPFVLPAHSCLGETFDNNMARTTVMLRERICGLGPAFETQQRFQTTERPAETRFRGVFDGGNRGARGPGRCGYHGRAVNPIPPHRPPPAPHARPFLSSGPNARTSRVAFVMYA